MIWFSGFINNFYIGRLATNPELTRLFWSCGIHLLNCCSCSCWDLVRVLGMFYSLLSSMVTHSTVTPTTWMVELIQTPRYLDINMRINSLVCYLFKTTLIRYSYLFSIMKPQRQAFFNFLRERLINFIL